MAPRCATAHYPPPERHHPKAVPVPLGVVRCRSTLFRHRSAPFGTVRHRSAPFGTVRHRSPPPYIDNHRSQHPQHHPAPSSAIQRHPTTPPSTVRHRSPPSYIANHRSQHPQHHPAPSNGTPQRHPKPPSAIQRHPTTPSSARNPGDRPIRPGLLALNRCQRKKIPETNPPVPESLHSDAFSARNPGRTGLLPGIIAPANGKGKPKDGEREGRLAI